MDPNCIAIVTDSTCDIPQELIERYQIAVMPHVVIWDGKQYRDRIDLQPREFYHRLETDKAWPTTSQATVEDFSRLYLQAAERGACAIIDISVAGALSGALRSAQQAADQVSAKTGIPIRVFDSYKATMGLGWQVLAAARARDAGASVEEILSVVDQVRAKMNLVVCMNTVEYVYRGGRIGHATRLVGAALNIKPVIYLDNYTGMVEQVGVQFTFRKAREMMYRRFFDSMDTSKPLHVAVMHGDAEQDARELVDRIRQEYHPVELISDITGPVLGIHTGPRAMGLAGYWED